MDTAGFLVHERRTIVREAEGALTRLHERHYESLAVSEVEKRLEVLFDELVDAVSKRDLSSIVAYACTLARERFDAGYDLSEVQAAFNALEAATWTRIDRRSRSRRSRRGARPRQHCLRRGEGRARKGVRVACHTDARALARPDGALRRHGRDLVPPSATASSGMRSGGPTQQQRRRPSGDIPALWGTSA